MSPDPSSDLRCERIRLLLSSSLDGEATAAQDAEIADHLPGCADCRAAAAVDHAVRERCAQPAVVPEGFAERVAGAAIRQRLETRAQNRFLVAAAVAAVLVAGASLFTFRPSHGPDGGTLRADAPRDLAGRALRAGLASSRTPFERVEDR
jgi:predicted anti-sigma-YlaC factor YlaD